MEVPFADNDEVKALGARWDPSARAWYVPPGGELKSFAHWLTLLPNEDEPQLTVVGLPQQCWRCGERTTAVIACEDSGQLVYAHEEVLQVIASQLTDEDLAEVGAGPLRPRFSRTLGCSSWSNGCVACGVLLGGFPLFEAFVDCLSGEAALPRIGVAKVPFGVLYRE